MATYGLIDKILKHLAPKSEELTYESAFTAYTSGVKPMIRKQGNVCHFDCVCKPSAAIEIGTTKRAVCTIPEEYRPTRTIYTMCNGSSMNVFLCSVTSGGVVQVERYRPTNSTSSTYASVPTTAWLPISISWIVD